MAVQPCQRSSNSNGCLCLYYTRNVAILRNDPGYVKVPHGWIEAVDPDSYRLRDDRDTYGILWCRDEACANYYRYSERPAVQRCRQRVGQTAYWFHTYAGFTADPSGTGLLVRPGPLRAKRRDTTV